MRLCCVLECQHGWDWEGPQHQAVTWSNHCLSLSRGCKDLAEQPGLPGKSQGWDEYLPICTHTTAQTSRTVNPMFWWWNQFNSQHNTKGVSSHQLRPDRWWAINNTFLYKEKSWREVLLNPWGWLGFLFHALVSGLCLWDNNFPFFLSCCQHFLSESSILLPNVTAESWCKKIWLRGVSQSTLRMFLSCSQVS